MRELWLDAMPANIQHQYLPGRPSWPGMPATPIWRRK